MFRGLGNVGRPFNAFNDASKMNEPLVKKAKFSVRD